MIHIENDLREWVAIPSVSADPAYEAQCQKAAEWLKNKLSALKFEAKLVPTGGKPLVMAQRTGPKEWPHVVVYGHYDVQPAEPLELWKTKPYELTKVGSKLYARGAADNKGPSLALIAGLGDAIAANPELPVRITCLIEGEEESGSKNLPGTLKKLKKELGAIDFVILSDTESRSEKELMVMTGTRGVMAFDVKITALARDLHSGQGGAVPNAVRELTRLTGSLYDADGWVNIPGFYKGCIKAPAAELKALKKLNDVKKYAKELGAKGFYKVDGKTPFEVCRYYPSLELNGIKGGYQGEGSKTIVPAQAIAKMTCRIAPGQNPDQLRKAIFAALEKRVGKIFELEIIVHEKGHPAYAVPLPHLDKNAKAKSPKLKDGFLALERAVKKVTGNGIIYERDGASIPILSEMQHALGADAIMMGLFGPGSLLHSPNEGVSLPLLETGRKVWAQFFKELAGK